VPAKEKGGGGGKKGANRRINIKTEKNNLSLHKKNRIVLLTRKKNIWVSPTAQVYNPSTSRAAQKRGGEGKTFLRKGGKSWRRQRKKKATRPSLGGLRLQFRSGKRENKQFEKLFGEGKERKGSLEKGTTAPRKRRMGKKGYKTARQPIKKKEKRGDREERKGKGKESFFQSPGEEGPLAELKEG